MVHALKTTSALLATVLIATLLSSCGGKDTHEKITEDALDLMEKCVSSMEGVENKADAEKTAKKLESLLPKFEKLADRAKKIGDPDEETEKALEEKFEKRMEELGTKMMTNMMAMASKDPEIMKIIQEPFEKIGKAMEDVK